MARRRSRFAALSAALAVLLAVTQAPGNAAPRRTGDRVADLVAAMTLDEKIGMLHGGDDPVYLGQSGFVAGVPRLGIPDLRLVDGAAGIRASKPSTALPAPVALASTFDPTLARRFGEVLGRNGRAAGFDALLGPVVGAIRTPYGGRNFETYSEDPLVSARIAASTVRGVQDQGLMAVVKHFAGNNQEAGRETVDAQIGERALHEIELPGFESSIAAGAAGVLCAYNTVNGAPACGNRELLTGILREQWNFQGWVMSDWGATHSTDAILAGLDQEMPDDTYFGSPLKIAVLTGRIPMAAVDTAVSRILGQLDRFGLLDGSAGPRPSPDPDAAKVARRVAEDGAVLLRNKGNALPLGKHQRIAVIGPTAQLPKVSGLGSARGNPALAAAPLDEIRKRADGTVTYSPGGDLHGVPMPAAVFDPPLPMSADGETSVPLYVGYYGTVTVPETGDYRFFADVPPGDNLIQMSIDDRDSFGGGFGLGTASVFIHLTKGTHDIKLIPVLGPALSPVTLRWTTPQRTHDLIAPAVAAAKRADVAVVFAYDDESEGIDRLTLNLPDRQNALIAAVAKANPNTVVVLNTGSATLMPWLRQVRSVLQMWYPGEQGAQATARLLFGAAAPGGRLTQTFPADERRTPVAAAIRYPGVDGVVRYDEGVLAGYRWYDRRNVRPLRPFGFGLAYTTFDYSDLRVRRTGDGFDVSLLVRNTGSRRGAAVPQLYLGPSREILGQQAKRALAGWAKVELKPGEAKRVRIHLGPDAFRYWSTEHHAWRTGGGHRAILVGPSSADLPLRSRVDV